MDQIQFQFTQFTGTLAPTAVTTLAPTQSTLTPTIIPTLNPVSSGSVNSPTGQPIAQNTLAMVEDNEAQSIDLLLFIAIIVGAVGFLCLFGELIAFKMRKKRRKAELVETSGIMRESINIATESKWNKDRVQQWLEDIKFPQYYSEFVENGYDSIRVIKAIRSKSELSDIGITMPGHQTFIVAEIKKLDDWDLNEGKRATSTIGNEPGACRNSMIDADTETIGVEIDDAPTMTEETKGMLTLSNSEQLYKVGLDYETIGAPEDV